MPDVTHFVANWAPAIGRACWQGGLAILLAWLVCRCFPRLSPRLQCWLWRLAYLKLLVTLIWVTPLNLPLLPPTAKYADDALMEALDPTLPSGPIRLSAPLPAASGGIPLVFTALFCLWLVGCSWQFWQFGKDWAYARHLRRRSRAIEDGNVLAECRELCAQLGMPRCPQLLMSEGQEGPLLIGLLRPAILLPEALWNSCTPAQQRLILAHELAHLNRRDLLWAWIPGLSRCLFFFLPLVWLAEREWQQSQEMACDEQVLRLAGASRAVYGEALLKVTLQPGPLFPSGLVALRVAESYTTVRRRLLAMKHAGNISRRTLLAVGALAIALGLIGIIPWRVSAQDSAKKEIAFKRSAPMDGMLSEEMVKALGLSEKQMREVKELHEAIIQQVRQVLTPEQQQKLAAQEKMLGLKANHEEAVLASLGLTPAQKDSIKELHANTEHQMIALKQDGSLNNQQREEHMKAIAEAQDKQLQQILTPEQRKKLAEAHIQLKQQASQQERGPNLTEAQSQKLSAIKMQIGQQMEAIERDASLSQEQKEVQLKALKEKAELQFKQVLTPEQQKAMAMRNQQIQAIHNGGFYGMANLELLGMTDAQKQRIQAIHQDAEKQFLQILTPEQMQKLHQLHSETGKPRHE